MAVALRRALVSLSTPGLYRPMFACLSSSALDGRPFDREAFVSAEEAGSQDVEDRSSRPASAPCLEVPSTSYPPSPTSKRARPSPGQRASFRHAAFQAAAEAAARELSGTPPGVLTSWGTAAPVMEAVVPEDAAGTPTTKDGLWRGRPIKQLTIGLKRIGGRNNTGRTTIWHRGGGHKRLYRVIDFKRQGDLVTDARATVQRIEYDPNRNAHIALIRYASGHVSYILAPEGLKTGDVVMAGQHADIKPGNALPLGNIPRGTVIHNIELTPGRGGQLVRAAGTSAQLIGQVDRYSQVRLQSGEMRMILAKCMATVGSVSNANYHNINWGKAGKSRWLGWRPTVRGVAMNPIDHPHGGGEGKTSGGRKSSMSPWAKPAKGGKTRNKKKPSTKLIMSRRKKASAR